MSRSIRAWALGSLSLCAIAAHAQRSTGVGQIDTNYVKDYSHLVTGRLFSSTKFNALRITGGPRDGDIIYRPNNQINLGVGVSYRKLTLNLGFRAPFVNNDDDRYGRTRYLDAQANMLSPERATNLFLQYFQGYYIPSHGPSAFGWNEQETDHPYRPDVREFNIGFSTLRMFNSKRFSYRAAFNQDAWQRRSQGSWMFGGYAVYYTVRADSSLIPARLREDFEPQASVRIGDYGDLGPMGGYAYTHVLGGHWFLSGSLAAGLGLSIQHVVYTGGEATSFGPGWHLQGRAGIGYNSKRHQVGLTFNQERIQYLLPRQDVIAWSVSNVRFNIVYRFRERVPALDKAVRWLKRKNPADNAVPATDQKAPKR